MSELIAADINKNMLSGMDILPTISGDEYVEVIKRNFDGSYKNYRVLASKLRTVSNAYDFAVENGFVGTLPEWLECTRALYARDESTYGKVLVADAHGVAQWSEIDASIIDGLQEELDLVLAQARAAATQAATSASSAQQSAITATSAVATTTAAKTAAINAAAAAGSSANQAQMAASATLADKVEVIAARDEVAVTATTVEAINAEINQSKVTVANSAAAALLSEQRAATSATAATAAATQANSSRDLAATSVTNAQTAATQAGTAKTAAETAATAAATSATQATAAKDAAALSATNAATSATAAAGSATAAATAKTAAEAVVSTVTAAKTAAEAAATAAATSRDTAAGHAGNASTAATQAAASATAAATSATSAQTAASAANAAKDATVTAAQTAQTAAADAAAAKDVVEGFTNSALEARDAAEGFAVDALSSVGETQTLMLQADAAKNDAEDAATLSGMSATESTSARDSSEAFAVNAVGAKTSAQGYMLDAQQAVLDAQAVIKPIAEATAPEATLTNNAVFPVSFGLGLLQTTLGKIATWLASQFNFSVTFEQFGAKGDGVTVDDAAIAAAVATGKVIKTRDDAVYLMSTTALKEGGSFILTGSATFKLKAAMILNTDTDMTHHTPLFRLQGMSWVDLGKCTFDGNRTEQTYPATGSGIRPGRGSNPYRHNALVEIGPNAAGTVQSSGVYITGAKFKESYMNGLALWQVRDAIVRDCVFTNTTWNGVAGAGLRNVKFRFNYFYRCGVSTQWPTARNQGDRAGVQVREFPKLFTTASEGIPCITTGEFANGGLNYDIEFTGNVGEECNVETIFGRAIRGLTGNGNSSINVGYGRKNTATFYPGHFWFEYCEGSFNNNSCYQTKVEAGDMQPDGYVAAAGIGDSTSLFPMIGSFNLDIRGNRALSGKDVSGLPVPGLLYRGIRMSANVNADGAYIDGTDNNGITIINNDAIVPPAANVRNNSANSSTIINTNLSVADPGEGPIGIQRFGGDTTGDIDNLSAMNCRVDAGKSVIVFNANLSAFNKTNVQSSTGVGTISASNEQVSFSTDGALYRRVMNTNAGVASSAGFQAQSNGGNLLSMGVTSNAYTGSAAVALAAFIQASTANTGGLYISANGGPIIMRPGGNRSVTMFASGRTKLGANTVDDGINLLQVGGLLGAQGYTVATLPVGVSNSSVAIATNGRKVGEGAGAGTGVPVYYSNGAWRVFGTDAAVTT